MRSFAFFAKNPSTTAKITRLRLVEWDFRKYLSTPSIGREQITLPMNLHALVIPLVSCADESSLRYMPDGMQDFNVVAFHDKVPNR